MKISLDSSRWDELNANWGTDRILDALPTLLSEADDDRKILALDEINDAIHHQQSVYTATYATVPWLIDAVEDQSLGVQSFIISMLGSIAFQGEPEQTRQWLGEVFSRAEVNAYYTAIEKAQQFIVRSIKETLGKDDSLVFSYFTSYASLMGQRGVYWRLRGVEEDSAYCGSCDTHLISEAHYLQTTTSELRRKGRIDDFIVPKAADAESIYALPVHRALRMRNPEVRDVKTNVVPRSGMPETSFISRITEIARDAKHPKHVRLFQAICGRAECPKCGEIVDLLECRNAFN